MSIIRVGLSETDGFAEGYEAIFGRKDKKETPAVQPNSKDSVAGEASKPDTGKGDTPDK